MELVNVFFSYMWRKVQAVWWQAAVLAVVLWLPADIVYYWVSATFFTDETAAVTASFFWDYMFYGLYGAIVWPLGSAMILGMLADTEARELDGEPVAVTGADWQRYLKVALTLWPSFILVRMLTGLGVGFATIACVLPGIFVSVKLVVADLAFFAEGERGSNALQRSWYLTTGHFWPILGLWMLLGAIMLLAILPVYGLQWVLNYYFPVTLEAHFWPVDVFTDMVVSVERAVDLLFAYCMYKYLVWRNQNPGAPLYEWLHPPLVDAPWAGLEPAPET